MILRAGRGLGLFRLGIRGALGGGQTAESVGHGVD
jgi:hypothetical protein